MSTTDITMIKIRLSYQ